MLKTVLHNLAVVPRLPFILRQMRTLRHSGFFDPAYYCQVYSDASRFRFGPLAHYVMHGAHAGRNPGPSFDGSYYLARNPDVAAAGINPLYHYLHKGRAEGRLPSPMVIPWLEKLGPSPVAVDLARWLAQLPATDPYQAWIAVNQSTPRLHRHLADALAKIPGKPARFSIIMPVFNPQLHWLDRAVATVRAQVYSNWELCIADDHSDRDEVRNHLARLMATDPARIKLTFRKERGHISAASNSAAELASGDFLVFLDQDDELAPEALAELALYIADRPDTDMVYTDSDKIDAAGRRFDPHFKPDWSPELLLVYMYAGQIQSMRRDLFDKIGGMRKGFEGAQDHDLALRAAAITRHIGHIPKVLYHWRALPGSTAYMGSEKQYSFEAARQAVQEALQRAHSSGVALRPAWAIYNGNALFHHEFPDDGPSVTIIIPVRNQPALLERCLQSLTLTSYRNYKVMIADDESDDPAIPALIERFGHRQLVVKRPDTSFNFARLNNTAVKCSDSEYVLFLNNDTEIIEPRWLTRMVGYAQLAGVGAVGALLTYPDGRIQHAGIIHGMRDNLADHAFKLLPEGNLGYMSHAGIARNCSAVTAACLLTPKALFLGHGGFDADAFAVAFNDPDYCFRLADAGYRSVICPGARLIHHEGKTRHPGVISQGDSPVEHANYRHRYRLRTDPYFNLNFSLDDGLFRIKPRHVVLHRPSPFRVLFFTHNLHRQGAPLMLADLIIALKNRHGIDPVVISPTDGPLKKIYETHDIPVTVGHLSQLPGTNTGPAPLSGALNRLVDKYSASVVVANTILGFDVVHAAHAANIPSLWIIHESEPCTHHFQHLSFQMQKTALAAFFNPYRCVFVAQATRSIYEMLDRTGNFTVIPNGLNMAPVASGRIRWPRSSARQHLGIPDDQIAVLALGTLCERKSQRDLLAAFPLIQAPGAERMHLFIVGEQRPDYYKLLLDDLRRLPAELQARISFAPETDDPALYYQAADIFVCNSKIESYPMVILEAMAHSLPIVTTPVFGIYEQVRDTLNALFYPPGDIPALAQTLAAMCDDKRRQAMTAASPGVLNSLPDHDDMCRAYATILREAAFSK